MHIRLEKGAAVVILDSQPLARGGEAAIYAIPGQAGLLAKVYHQPTPEHGAKLAAMIANPPTDPMAGKGHASIAWPLDRLLGADYDGRCLGFVMPRVEQVRPIFEVYNPKARLQACPSFHYGYLLRTARNLVSAVRALHERGYVLGDLNESNVLVTSQTLVTVVDTDSFQVRTAQRVYRCPVGKPEYTPPELQGVPFATVDRAPEHDAFALAVLIFQLLMQGTHPFAGRFTGAGEPETMFRRIGAGHWPYAQKKVVPFAPNPVAPPFAVLPPRVQELMRICFEDGHDRPSLRPTAAQWQNVLAGADGELTTCVFNAQHRFHNSVGACPWCELAKRQGRDPFPSRKAGPRPEDARGSVSLPPPSPAVATATATKVKPRLQTAPAPAARSGSAPRSSGRIAVKRPPAVLATLAPYRAYVLPCLAIGGGLALVVGVVLAVAAARAKPTPVEPPPPILKKKTPEEEDPPEGDPGIREDAQPGGNEPIPPKPDLVGELHRFEGQEGQVQSVACSHDGKSALSGGDDGTVRLWDVATGKLLRTYKGGVGAVRGVAFLPNDRRVVSGGDDGNVYVWGVDSGEALRGFQAHVGPVRAVVCMPDGKHVLSGGDDGYVRMWTVDAGVLVRAFEGHTDKVTSLACSRDGKRILSGSDDGTLCLWDADGSVPLHKFGVDSGRIQSVALSPDGRRALYSAWDGSLCLWDVTKGEEVRRYKGHVDLVWCVAFSPDGKRLLSGGMDGTVRLWEADGDEPLAKLEGHTLSVVSVAFSPDGRRALSGSLDKTMRLWGLPQPPPSRPNIGPSKVEEPRPKDPDKPKDPDQPAVVRPEAPAGQLQSFTGHNNLVDCVAYAPDGGSVISGGRDGLLRQWDVKTGREVRKFEGHAGAVEGVWFTPKGDRVLSCGLDGTVRLWTAADGKETRRFEGGLKWGAKSAALSADGLIVVAGEDSESKEGLSPASVRCWDVETRKEILRLPGHQNSIGTVAFSPDGRRLLSASRDGTVRLWEVRSGKEEIRLTFTAYVAIESAAFSPDGQNVVTAGKGGDVRLWNAVTGKEVFKYEGHQGTVYCVAFSRDGKQIVTGGDDKTVRVWNAATSKEVRKFTGHTAAVSGAAFSPDSRQVVSASHDKTVRLWDLGP